MSSPAFQDDLQGINAHVENVWEKGRQFGQAERERQFFGNSAAVLTARLFAAALREASDGLRSFSAGAAEFFAEEAARLEAFVTPPRIRQHDPGDGATGIVVNSPIHVQFVGAIREDSLTDDTFYVGAASGGPHLAGTISWDEVTLTATFTPENELSRDVEYKVTVEGVQAAGGMALEPAQTFAFTTEP